MPKRDACERRVYRLALLLTGSPTAATRVITAVVGAQADLRRLDNAHLDRLTILRAREALAARKPPGKGRRASARPAGSASRIVSDELDAAVAETLASLPPQPREAWVLAHVYGLRSREIARAMDCSVTATERHRARGEQIVGARLGSGVAEAIESLRAFSRSIDVPVFYRAQQRRRVRVRWIAGGILVGIGLAAWYVLRRLT